MEAFIFYSLVLIIQIFNYYYYLQFFLSTFELSLRKKKSTHCNASFYHMMAAQSSSKTIAIMQRERERDLIIIISLFLDALHLKV